MHTAQRKPVDRISFTVLFCYFVLTLLVWGIFVFDRGISALDEPNIIQEILSHARYGWLAQLFISVAPPGRIFLLTPYTLAVWSGHPIIVMQIVYGAAWLITGVLAFVLTRQLLASQPMAYLAGALTLTATGDFFTDYLGVMGGYLAAAYYLASLSCLLAWWKQRGVVWAVASGALLLLSMWTIEYAMPAILLTPLLIWAIDYFRISRRLMVMALWWYTLVFASIAILLSGILRPGDHRNDVLFTPISLSDRIWQILDFFLYNFAPHRWVLRSIPSWFMGYPPIFSNPLRITLVLGGVLVFLAVAVIVFRGWPSSTPAPQWYKYVVVGVACLLMVLASNAAMSPMGTEYFIRSHLVSRIWSSIAIALVSYVGGAFVLKRPYLALLIPTLFVGSGIYSGIERQDYQLGLWKRQQVELLSIVEQVPAVKPDTVFVLLVPPGAHPLLATSNINYLPTIYGDDTLQQRVFYWGPTWQSFSRCTAEAVGLSCGQLYVSSCGSTGECPPRLLAYDKIVLLVYSLSQNRFVLQHDIPAGILQAVTLPPGAYNPTARIETRPLPTYAQSLLYNASALSAWLPAEPDPNYQLSPLVHVDTQFGRSVTADIIDPWRSEQINGQSMLWLGPEHNYGLDGLIWSDKDQPVRLRLSVAPGPGRQDLLRTLRLEVTSGIQTSTEYQVFTSPALYSAVDVYFDIVVHPGRNDFRLSVLDTVTVPQQPNGDTRPLLARLDKIEIQPQPVSPGTVSSSCSMTIDDGWYSYEHTVNDWWRWTGKRGTVRIIVDRASNVVLRGDIYAAQRPNTIAVFVNGEQKAKIQATQDNFAAFEIATVQLKAGVNDIAFVSGNLPIQIESDNRPLAIAVRNLYLMSNTGSKCVTWQR